MRRRSRTGIGRIIPSHRSELFARGRYRNLEDVQFLLDTIVLIEAWNDDKPLALKEDRSFKQGAKILNHCGAGIGRSGALAVATLMKLGLDLSTANDRIRGVGSYPDTQEQKALLVKLAR